MHDLPRPWNLPAAFSKSLPTPQRAPLALCLYVTCHATILLYFPPMHFTSSSCSPGCTDWTSPSDICPGCCDNSPILQRRTVWLKLVYHFLWFWLVVNVVIGDLSFGTFMCGLGPGWWKDDGTLVQKIAQFCYQQLVHNIGLDNRACLC